MDTPTDLEPCDCCKRKAELTDLDCAICGDTLHLCDECDYPKPICGDCGAGKGPQ